MFQSDAVQSVELGEAWGPGCSERRAEGRDDAGGVSGVLMMLVL